MKNLLLMAALACLGVCGFVCEDNTVDLGQVHPGWVDSLITKYSAEPVGNPPQSIWQYRYNGAIVYFVPAQCCDQYSNLYDLSGTVIAHPDGGITGTGDGRCADFVKTATDPVLIWRDPRSRN
jgi:hypothetical protein